MPSKSATRPTWSVEPVSSWTCQRFAVSEARLPIVESVMPIQNSR